MNKISQKECDRRLRRSRIRGAGRAFAPRRDSALFRRRAVRAMAALPLLLVLGLPALAADLKVSVDGVRSAQGTIMIGLYDSAEGFNAAIKHST